MGVPATATAKKFEPQYTPDENGIVASETYEESGVRRIGKVNEKEPLEVFVTVKKDDKTATKSSTATLYTDPQDMIKREFHSSLEELLDFVNGENIKVAKNNARQLCYVFLAGPEKKLYVAARRFYRDAISMENPMEPKQAFDLALKMYSEITDVSNVVYDEKEIVKSEED